MFLFCPQKIIENTANMSATLIMTFCVANTDKEMLRSELVLPQRGSQISRKHYRQFETS